MALRKIKVLTEQEIAKKYGDDSYLVHKVINEISNLPKLPSRNLPLNYMIGGGITYGRVMEVFGYESTGKSLLSYDFAYATQQLGGIVLLADAENAFAIQWAIENGLDPERLIIYDKNSIEGISDWSRDMIYYWRSKLKNNEPILFITDSIAALECESSIESDMSDAKAEMGNRAKAIGKFYRTRNPLFKRAGVCVLMINQVRKKLGATMWESAETTPGGDATKFYASIRVGLIRSTQIKGLINAKGKFEESKEKGHKVGQNIIMKVEKNKLAPPRPQLKTEVYFLPDKFGYVGYSRYAGLDEILITEGIISKKGSRYYYKGKMICNGEKNFLSMIHRKPKLRGKLIAKSSIHTISKAKEQLTTIKRNLYPI